MRRHHVVTPGRRSARPGFPVVPSFFRVWLQRLSLSHGEAVEPCHRPGRLLVLALCAAVLSASPLAGASHMPTSARPTVFVSAQTQPEPPTPEDGSAEDLVPVPVGQPYIWPSRIGVLVSAPTRSGSGAAAVVRVRTTVLNESAETYDVWAILGPTASYDGHNVAQLADSRYAAATAEHIVPPGRELAYETTFPVATGRLTLQYRADFRFEAVVIDPVILAGPS